MVHGMLSNQDAIQDALDLGMSNARNRESCKTILWFQLTVQRGTYFQRSVDDSRCNIEVLMYNRNRAWSGSSVDRASNHTYCNDYH